MYSTLLHKPRNSGRFASLMELYEQNYLLMRLLAPELRQMSAGPFISSSPDVLSLELLDLVHDRYTSTFTLTYRFSDDDPRGRNVCEPNLTIRLYHDARSCEVMSGLLPQGRELRRTRDLEEGRRLNRFLNKWLRYCLRQGHGFRQQNGLVDDHADNLAVHARRYCTQC